MLEAINFLFSFDGLAIVFFGTITAMVTSFIPGMGSLSLSSLLILVTATWDVEMAMILFGAITGGATFMGSVTSILFNIPGSPQNSATLLDGFPLASQGRAKFAIGAAAIASAFGSIVGIIVLISILPFSRTLLLNMGPIQFSIAAVLGLISVIVLPSRSLIHSIYMALLGLILGLIGFNPISGVERWTWGNTELYEGINILATMIGIFSISELIIISKNIAMSDTSIKNDKGDSVWTGVKAIVTHWRLCMRASIIGTVVGMLPGVGGTAAGFIAYSDAYRSSSDMERVKFGNGSVRGLMAPEASVDAKDGGSLLPAITLGIPGSEAGVVLLTAFVIHGVSPGIIMLTTQKTLIYLIIFSLLLSNILTSLIGVIISPLLSKLKNIPLHIISFPLLSACLFLTFQIRGNISDVLIALAFGFIGASLKEREYPRVPLVIAFILAPFLERQFIISQQIIDAGRVSSLSLLISFFIGLAVVILVAQNLRMKGAIKKVAYRQDNIESILLELLVLAILAFILFSYRQNLTFDFANFTLVTTFCVSVTSIIILLRRCRLLGIKKEKMKRYWIAPLISIVIYIFGFPIGMSLFGTIWCLDNKKSGDLKKILLQCTAFATAMFIISLCFMHFVIHANDFFGLLGSKIG